MTPVYKIIPTAYNKTMTTTTLTDPEFQVDHSWEILPSPSGYLHVVDPDPDAQYENYPVSLCGTALLSKGGATESNEICETCVDILKEREGER